MNMSDNTKGAILMMGAMAGYTFNDACMKLLAGAVPLAQAVLLRGVLTCAALYLLGRAMGALSFKMPARDWKIVILRSACEVGATFFFLNALFHMPIANVTAVLQALPLTVALGAALFFGEHLGWRRLLAIMVGFAGVMLIVQPGSAAFSIWSLYAIGAMVCVTIRDLLSRSLSRNVSSMTVAFVAAILITTLFGVQSIFVTWQPLDLRSSFLLVLAAGFILGGYYLSVAVMRVGEISVIAPMRYTGLLWALILGVVLFGDWPDTLTLFGTGLVVATGVFTFYRERKMLHALR